MSGAWQDLRVGARYLLRNPTFTAVATLTLALGVGANTAIYSVIDAYLLRPLPHPHAERLVLLRDRQPTYGVAPASLPEFLDWRAGLTTYEKMTAYFRRDANVQLGEGSERVRISLVADGYFALFGARALHGRLFAADEEVESAPPVVVLEHGFWQSRFGGDPSAVGSTVRIDDVPHLVVGVLGPGEAELRSATPAAAFVPLLPNAPWTDRGTHFLTVMARLAPRSSVAAARAEADALSQRLDAIHGFGHATTVEPLRDFYVGSRRPTLLVLLGAVGFVLLVASANVASLQLARWTGRAQELAVRAALGASTRRLARQLLTESLLLAGLGGLAGVAFGAGALRLLLASWPARLTRPPGIELDGRVLLFAALATLAAGLLSGAGPALFGRDRALAAGFGGARGQVGSPRHQGRLRTGLVAAEVALTLVLLVGAGLVAKSLARLLAVDPGFRPDGLVTFALELSDRRYPDTASRAGFAERLLERASALPGVDAVAAANTLPLDGGMSGDFETEGHSLPSRERPNAQKRIVSAGYFDTLDATIRRGRAFDRRDVAGAPPVVLVNETLARREWPGEDPIGKRLRSLTCSADCWEEVIGVVADARATTLDQPPLAEIYYPLAQAPPGGLVVVARTEAPQITVAALRDAIAELDPQQPIFDVRTMNEVIAASIADRRLVTFLLGSFAALALALATLGIGGLVAYSVAQRTREIGLRLALGSTPRAATLAALRRAMTPVAAGLAVGLAGATALTRLLAAQLYEVSPFDPAAFLGAVAALSAGAACASYLPARRAASVEPTVALREP